MATLLSPWQQSGTDNVSIDVTQDTSDQIDVNRMGRNYCVTCTSQINTRQRKMKGNSE